VGGKSSGFGPHAGAVLLTAGLATLCAAAPELIALVRFKTDNNQVLT